MSLESIPGIATRDLFDVLAALAAAWASSGVDTEILIGEKFVNDEGAGNRVVFVPLVDVGVAKSAPIRLDVGGRATLEFGCDAYVWGIESSDETTKHRSALGILHNIIITLPDVSGDRVFLVAAGRTLEPNEVDYGHQYRLSFYLLYQVDASTNLIVPPKPYSAEVTAILKDPS